MSIKIDIKNPKKTFLSLTKESGKGQPRKMENFYTITILLQSDTMGKLWPHPHPLDNTLSHKTNFNKFEVPEIRDPRW